MSSLRLSRVRFIYPVLLAGAEHTNFQETDNWYSDQSPPDVARCAYVINFIKDEGIITITNRDGHCCFAALTNLVSGNFYPDTLDSGTKPKGKNTKADVVVKSDPLLDRQIALEADLATAGLQLRAPKLTGATPPAPVLATISSEEKKAIKKSNKRSPLVKK